VRYNHALDDNSRLPAGKELPETSLQFSYKLAIVAYPEPEKFNP
jgi:hypothetical protein